MKVKTPCPKCFIPQTMLPRHLIKTHGVDPDAVDELLPPTYKRRTRPKNAHEKGDAAVQNDAEVGNSEEAARIRAFTPGVNEGVRRASAAAIPRLPLQQPPIVNPLNSGTVPNKVPDPGVASHPGSSSRVSSKAGGGMPPSDQNTFRTTERPFIKVTPKTPPIRVRVPSPTPGTSGRFTPKLPRTRSLSTTGTGSGDGSPGIY